MQLNKSFHFLGLIAILMLLAACTPSGSSTENSPEGAVDTSASQPSLDDAQEVEEAAPPPPVTNVSSEESDEAEELTSGEPGIITGVAYLMAPPTPAMTIYAVDPETGKWATMDMDESDGMSTFSLSVEPGTYQLFTSLGLGYPSEDGWSLGFVTVAAGKSVADIEVRPPGPSDCGPMFGIPASPDGQFAAIPGATDECKESVMNRTSEVSMDGPLQPLGSDCTTLQETLESALQLPVSLEQMPVTTSWNGQVGSACQIAGLANGNNFNDIGFPLDGINNVLLANGWTEMMYSPCLGYGGAGPYAGHSCFERNNEICESFVQAGPQDDALCENIDGPITNCMETLAPEQIAYNLSLTCAVDTSMSSMTEDIPLTEQFTLEFLEGTTNTTVHQSIQPESLHDYVFSAQAGQAMNVHVYATIDGVEAPASAVLDFGAVGYEPITNYVLEWSGELPTTGDYYIDVKSMADVPVDYALYVEILPLEGSVVSETTGAISGGIAYPNTYVPLLHIVAFNQNNDDWHWIGAKENSFGYTFPDLPPGEYHIIAYSQHELVGAYASAGDGEPILVTVEAGKVTEGIDIFTWLERDNPHFPGTSNPVGW